MKKNLLLLLFIMVTTLSSAQFTIWEDDFDDADVSDWTLLDRDGNGSNWYARKNIQVDENFAIVDGTISVLGTYNIDFATLGQLPAPENNLAIAPVIDASFYSGKISLIINAQTSVYDSSQNLFVYGSTSPDPATFTLLSTVVLVRTADEGEMFKNYTVDISQYKGETAVYLAFGTKTNSGFIGYEIDKISVTAESLLGVDDVEQQLKACRLNQNPVQESLQLQLAEELQNEETALKIYNAAGSLVKESPYKQEDLSVTDLPQGIYFLVVSNNELSKKIKFIKK
ncbi:T9SS type A sorting domain-containing protein [Flavobacterium sp. N1736]|uniref:T9SS type A sorting domain-containing protein n=1 Tax=Flavobacterium sp. N1736 TaxID=2986823 RepID=UPI002225AF98|nr:T9SS type A sorting domain-containing protein [Flavobacterium sp. N1736]